MRRSLCSLALSGVLAVAGTAVFAQSDTAEQQPSTNRSATAQSSMPTKMHHAATPDEQAARMAKHLKLTADQQSSIKPILVDRQQQTETLRQDHAISKQDKMARMKSLRDDSNAKIEALLNDSQKQQFEQMHAKRQQRWQQKQGGETGTAPASSPS